MSTPYARPSWVDGPFGIARPTGLPEFSSPIPSVKTEYVLRQKWYQFRNNFTPLDLNTPHPDYSDFLLVEEGPRQDIDGGVVEWTRVYAKLPATHSEWESFSYNFTGFLWQVNSGLAIKRAKEESQYSVKSRLQHDYFLVPSNGVTDPILGGSTFNISTPGDIPKIWAQQYVLQNTIGGDLLGGILLATDVLNPSGSVLPTWPTAEQYQNMVASALTSGWGSAITKVVLYPDNTLGGAGHMAGTINTGSSTLGGQIAAEDSRLDRWMGNIWMRRTRFVLAQ